MKGAFCISLDFEKFWGIHDIPNAKVTIDKFNNISQIVDRLLSNFRAYNIHCTWATVGMLNFESISKLSSFCEGNAINYKHKIYSPYPISKHQLDNVNPNLILANSEILKISESQNQELASHTFSHFYTLEEGQTINDFKIDLGLNKKAINTDLKSIIFPRNQINEAYLKTCHSEGFLTYRGNQDNIFWRNQSYSNEKFTKKMGRVIDAYLKISKDNLTDWSDLKLKKDEMINIPANRFLRPYQFNSLIESLKIIRIKRQMTKAAKHGKIYHLWWHPHNFSNKTDKNFTQLTTILDHFQFLKKEYGFESLNMDEIAKKSV